ncbi:MAG: OprO/OprP family phosphate-selective porin [Holophagaceae bacterium]|nr:OprO/OprP family phosphate-selective porin [Holophagaceae bacterium]
MNKSINALTAMILLSGLAVSAQVSAPRVGGLAHIWYTQMLDSNLRHFDSQSTGFRNANFQNMPQFKENGFSIKRIDLKVDGKISDDVEYYINIDPTISNSAVLQDVFIKYKMPHKIELMVGQFKPFQTFDGFIPPADALFAEYAQLANLFSGRERGAWLSKGFGSPEALSGRLHVGITNGYGKNNDLNSQKDIVARLDLNYGKRHYFGGYALQGSTDQPDTGGLKAIQFNGANAPSDEKILDNKDNTSHCGVFYNFRGDKIYMSAEVMTGIWGRRFFPSVYASAVAPASLRAHLDQAFLSYVGVFAYDINKHHKLLARYDYMDYNHGDKWYSDRSPYVIPSGGLAGDYAPKFTEITLGYTYAFLQDSHKAANIKANYVMRSKNFLYPRPGQTGEQGGDSLVVALQVAF